MVCAIRKNPAHADPGANAALALPPRGAQLRVGLVARAAFDDRRHRDAADGAARKAQRA